MTMKEGSEHTVLSTDVCAPRREEVKEYGFPSAEVLAVHGGSWQTGLGNLECLLGANCQENSLSCGVHVGEEMLQRYKGKAEMKPARNLSSPELLVHLYQQIHPGELTLQTGRGQLIHPPVSGQQCPKCLQQSHLPMRAQSLSLSFKSSSRGPYTFTLRDPFSWSLIALIVLIILIYQNCFRMTPSRRACCFCLYYFPVAAATHHHKLTSSA